MTIEEGWKEEKDHGQEGGQEGVREGKYDEITLLTPENGTVKRVTMYNGHRSTQTKIKLSCHFFKGEN